MTRPTVRDLVLARRDDDRVALVFGDSVWSWRELIALGARRSGVLRALLDPNGPPHVGVLLENTPDMVTTLIGGALGGYVTVGLNATRRGDALAADIHRADCQVVLTDSTSIEQLSGLDLGAVRVLDVAELPTAEGVIEESCPDPAVFMMIFTSGTTGDPKAVPVASTTVASAGAAMAQRFGIGPDDVCYVSMPLFHSNAVISGLSVALASGARIALARRFSARGFLSDVRRYGVTYMNYVGKPLAYILATPRHADDADNSLRLAFGNEASDRDAAEFAERFGCKVRDGFGSTEMAITIRRVPGTPSGSIGQAPDEVSVFDRDTLTECPRARFDSEGRVVNLTEAVGELVNTHGPGEFLGYYNDPAATAERLRGGMYWSGDLAYRDEHGFVYLAGRTGDWLRVDGENQAAAPIERILLRHSSIDQAAVYGVPDADVGDQVMAALVLDPGATLTPDELERFLAAQPDLSSKGWPRYVRIMAELPVTATNKVLKRELRLAGPALATWIRAERGRTYELSA